jgi:phosphate transport system permease protein
VVLPSAIPGISTAVVLTAGRIVGETAPLILTMGSTISPNAYYSLNPLETGEALAVHIWKLAVVVVPGMQNSTEVAWGSALVIMLVILILNSISDFLIVRYRRTLAGK